jgi:hypothetical protein
MYVFIFLFHSFNLNRLDRFGIQPPEDAFVRWLIEQYSIPLAEQDDVCLCVISDRIVIELFIETEAVFFFSFFFPFSLPV